MICLISEKSIKDPKDPPNNNPPNDNDRPIFPDHPWITKKLLDLHPDFKTNPNLLREWVIVHVFSWGEIEEWLKLVKPNEADFAHWITSVKAMSFPADSRERIGYFYPGWLRTNNIDINALREEYEKWKENNS